MAKLNKTMAKKVDSEKSVFDPLPEGVYHCRLRDVDASREGPAGPYWSWEYEVVAPEEYIDRRLWNNTTLAEGARFGLKQTFDAFGVPTDTDTDELLGKIVRLSVSTRTIQKGARAGELGNNVEKVMPPEEGFEAPSPVSGQPAAEDIFT